MLARAAPDGYSGQIGFFPEANREKLAWRSRPLKNGVFRHVCKAGFAKQANLLQVIA
jgi:hypothetical protein